MNIKDVIDRYFVGDTSIEEERLLRDYFSDTDNIDEEIKYLQPMFNYLSDEAKALQVLSEVLAEEREDVKRVNDKSKVRKLVIIVSSFAASLLIGAFLLFGNMNNKSKNYVWIDGERITNPEVVSEYAEASFSDVVSDNDILEQQLGSFFE
ncbi:MAG: hypothetical protein GXZ03_11320 [Proteiniphilum sp.]|nr:hypothetical protein [Proteiniphilum sp.]